MKRWIRFVVLAAWIAAAAPVSAAWVVPGPGSAAAAATTMPAGSAPTASAGTGSIAVRWPTASMANGVGVAGYVIKRYNAINGAGATVGPGCSGVVTATTCTELSVPAGTWLYTDTPVQLSWTGTESPPSGPVTV